MRTADPELQGRRREAIVLAATGCFLKRGFHGTSVGDIAAAAGISMGLLYRYFTNKDAIIEAVAQRDTADTLVAVLEVAGAARLDLGLRTFISDQAAAMSSPDYAALVAEIAAESLRNPAIMKLWTDADDRVRTALEEAIAAHPDAAGAGRQRVASLAALVLALIDGISTRALLPGQPPVEAMLNLCRLTP